ncbi:GNAT family N-acetyltransferase [Stygiolobus caldivivus]|uniref:N-acetyltransferase domain-containing protein n=1 Tax=Stygiolobus caldivivus TaxID=2824673 RepID=A0A8D5ZKN9_9CREN|nr:GNAT family N-acetyltransferase [Stygiolobus caldivivus]BCU71580.1 hypothetical protein KN1_28770 [Stygiolobus caldivivus]
MIIRVATHQDIREMVEVWGEAIGSTNTEANREVFLIFLELGKCLIAEERGRVIATCCYIPYRDVSWVGNVGVRPEYQHKRIGKRIMTELLSEIKTRSVRLDSTNPGIMLYRGLGFEEEYKTVVYDISGVKDGRKANVTDRLDKWMLHLDGEAFGDDRSKLLSRISGKVVYNEGGFGVIYRNFIGPLIAVDKRNAEELIKYSVSSLGVKMIITIEDKEEFIESLGGRKVYECTRMRRGGIVKEDRGLIYGIFRHAFG